MAGKEGVGGTSEQRSLGENSKESLSAVPRLLSPSSQTVLLGLELPIFSPLPFCTFPGIA